MIKLPNGKIAQYNDNLYYGSSNTQVATNAQITNLQAQINTINNTQTGKVTLIQTSSVNISISLSGQTYQQFYKLYNFSGNNMIPIFSSYYNISWSGTVNLSNSTSYNRGVGIGFVKVGPVNQYDSNGINGIVAIQVNGGSSLNYTYPQSQYTNEFSNIYNVLYNQSMCLNGDYHNTGGFNIPLGITNENVLQITTNNSLTGTLNINISYSMYAIVLMK